jgi:SEC-C motif
MSRKLGRNDPCWCGSKKKYKKCHLNREGEKQMPFEAIVEAERAASRLKHCLHPLAASGVCDRIVSAHTIQRSRAMQQIIDSTNHVRTFFPMMPDGSTGGLQLHRVGWREASTFTGFCAKHDSLTFKPLETVDFDGSPEQCFLIGYRALCHEIHQKSSVLKSEPALRSLVDRGFSEEEQRLVHAMWETHEAGARKGLSDFQELKTVMDRELLSRDYSGWRRAVIRFRGDLCVASTGAVSPNRDIDGRPLQVLHDLDAAIEELPFGIVATPEGGAAVFIWRIGDVAPRNFVESLLKREKRSIAGLIVQFVFAYIENTYFSNSWWGSLSKANREHLASLAAIGNAYYSDFVYQPCRFVPWEITELSIEDLGRR